MRKVFTDDHHYQRNVFVGPDRQRKRYGLFRFLFDCFMVVITSGFWILWIFVREMRKR